MWIIYKLNIYIFKLCNCINIKLKTIHSSNNSLPSKTFIFLNTITFCKHALFKFNKSIRK